MSTTTENVYTTKIKDDPLFVLKKIDKSLIQI